MTKAELNRSIALGMLSELYIPTSDPDGISADLTTYDTEQIAGNIEKLAALGRTQRWQAAINGWARAVRSETEPRGIRWAFVQYMVYACHAI